MEIALLPRSLGSALKLMFLLSSASSEDFLDLDWVWIGFFATGEEQNSVVTPHIDFYRFLNYTMQT